MDCVWIGTVLVGTSTSRRPDGNTKYIPVTRICNKGVQIYIYIFVDVVVADVNHYGSDYRRWTLGDLEKCPIAWIEPFVPRSAPLDLYIGGPDLEKTSCLIYNLSRLTPLRDSNLK